MLVSCAFLYSACGSDSNGSQVGSASLSGDNAEILAGNGRHVKILEGKLYVDETYYGDVPSGASVKYTYRNGIAHVTVDGIERRPQ